MVIRLYQTQYTDPTTGDVIAQSRWYSPSSATFRSRDTYSGNLNTPVSLNRYTYAHNNPIRYSDPTGFCVEIWVPSCADQDVLAASVTKVGNFDDPGHDANTTALPNTSFHCPPTATSCGPVTSSGDTPGPMPLVCPTGCGATDSELTVAPASQGLPPTADLIEACRRGGSCSAVSVDQYFGFDGPLLDFLDEKETRDWKEWSAMVLGYPFGTGEGRTLGPYNIFLDVADGVWSGHGAEITEFFDLNQTMYSISHPSPVVTPGTDTFVPFATSPVDRFAPTNGSWPGQAEGPMGRIVAGLYVQDLQAYWTVELAEAQRTGTTIAVPVNPLEAALLDYRFDRNNVETFIFSGVQLDGREAGDLAVWLASGLTR